MSFSLLMLIPAYNDWEAIEPLLQKLDAALANPAWACDVLLVNDGSTEPLPESLQRAAYSSLRQVSVLHLNRNLGHQRAIATGLVYVHGHEYPNAVLVMDGDGEDRPEDIPELLAAFEEHGGGKVVFAARAKRLESRAFRFFYNVFRMLHRLLIGLPVRIGNFSVLPARYLPNLVVSSDLWNHYAAAVVRARIPFVGIPIARGKRLRGRSKMNFYSLAVHGFSAMSVFIDLISVRLLAVAVAFSLLSLLLLAVVISVRLFVDLAIPGWATVAAGLLMLVFLQMVLLGTVLVFLVMHSRTTMGFLPVRDGHYFIRDIETIYRAV